MLLFVLIFLFAGLGLVLVGRNFEQKARRSASWPTASGHLERCEVVELPGSGTEDASSWQLQIRYSYAVRGRRYESTQYAFGYGDGRDDKKHRLIATALRSQAKLTVHYNPSNPSEAVLSTQVQSNITTLEYFALAMALVSALIWTVD
jgi:hypothetical protein